MTKAKKAIEYLERIKATGREITEEDKNNAANIFADSYADYMEISEALEQ